MTKRYKLELYLIRDNELEFALHDKEAETSQGTLKMVENKINRQNERINELEHKLEHWKQFATVAQSENSILHNELGIAIEQGYALSDAFKEYKKGKVQE